MEIHTGRAQLEMKAIREIFFNSSVRKNFQDEFERESYFLRWTQYYISEWPQFVYTAHDGPEGEVIGYLMGCPESANAMGYFSTRVPFYALFADLFTEYPAHLHINLSEGARGRGVGSQLIDAYIQDLKSSQGVHIVTAPSARNVSFYRHNQFSHEIIRKHGDTELLFMGRALKQAE
jgi:GNAT superfamily N-acetyltransferase